MIFCSNTGSELFQQSVMLFCNQTQNFCIRYESNQQWDNVLWLSRNIFVFIHPQLCICLEFSLELDNLNLAEESMFMNVHVYQLWSFFAFVDISTLIHSFVTVTSNGSCNGPEMLQSEQRRKQFVLTPVLYMDCHFIT